MKPSRLLFAIVASLTTAILAPAAGAQVTFTGVELLGRPTDHSITINVVPNAAIQAYFEYGAQSGGPYTLTSPAAGASAPASTAANVPLVVELNGLSPNTQYFYRMIYRQTGTSSWTTRDEHSFVTQRPPGSTFVFTITSDSHLNNVFGTPALFQQTLQNVAADHPDFHLDLGDTFPMDNVTTQANADTTYLGLRPYFGAISPSVPVFLATGNHAQEEGWHRSDTSIEANSPPIMGANSRKKYYLNPNPLVDPFYTGNVDTSFTDVSGDHTVNDYYAWQWGDALFVVFDPYWYTTTKPYIGNMGGGESSQPGSGDRWDWTLGIDQYLWLKQTLESSTAKYKFLFAHQVAGGMDDYGRGGAYAVPFVEWGGYDDDGVTQEFTAERPGWAAPVEQLLVDNNVTAVFHGHDHEFAYEQRDGIVYQLIPMAADATYGFGFQDYSQSNPDTLKVLSNTGHIRVTVSPSQVTVDYVRAYLAGAGTNGQVAYTYTMGASVTPDFSLSSSPASQTVTQAGSTSYTASVGALNGFSGTVALAISGLPAGAAGTFTPPSVSSGSSTLNVSTSANTPPGTYTLTITATSGALSHTSTVSLTVNPAPQPDFTFSATPGSQSVTPGSATSYTASVSPINGFSAAVSLKVAGLPAGATGTFTPASISGSGSSTLNVTTSSTTAPGTYTLTLTATSGALSHASTVSLTVNAAAQADFTLSATPTSQAVTAGSAATYATTIGALNGFTGRVTFRVTGLPSGATGTFSPTSVTRSGSTTLTVGTGTSTPGGTSTLTITATSGTLSHTFNLTLVVNAPAPDFTFSASPSSQNVTPGGATSYSATLPPLNGFGATAALTVSGLPSGAAGTFNPPSITASGSSTLNVTTTSTTPTGTYTVTITATSGNLAHSATVTLVVSSAAQGNFTLSASSASLSVTQSFGINDSVTVSATGGFAGTVTLSVSGLPSDSQSEFAPATIAKSGNSTLSIVTSSSTPAGTYAVVVTGTSGALSNSVNITLVVKSRTGK